jgi:hypothetical protein
VAAYLKISKRIVIPKCGIVALPAGSRFLADRPGFGMTRDGAVFEHNCTTHRQIAKVD